jgi:hypothetical protein
MQWLRYCWTITMETVFSMWFVPRCYKQDSLKQQVSCWLRSCQQFSWVKWQEVAGGWVREFSWKLACENQTRRLAWNGCQPGTQFSWQEFCMGLQHRGRGIAIVNICYQATASEDCNRLKEHGVSYSDLWSVVKRYISVQLIQSSIQGLSIVTHSKMW